MGNFDDHVRYGYAAYVLVLTAIIGAVLGGGVGLAAGAVLAVVAAPLTMLGAVFPDVDHHASHPHRAFKRLVFVVVSISTMFVLGAVAFDPLLGMFEDGVAGYPRAEAAATLHGASLLLGVGAVRLVVRFRPTHRGITHRVPTGAILAAAFGSIGWYVAGATALTNPPLAAAVLGGAFFVGFLSHLACDSMLKDAMLRPGTPL